MMSRPPDLDEFRRRATSWLREHAEAAPPDYGAIMPPRYRDIATAWQRLLYDTGYAGIEYPTCYGGAGLTPAHRTVWFEECARAAVPPVLNMVGCTLACTAILSEGTEDQRERLVRPTLQGDIVWCQLFSEDVAGSDLASLRTSAVQSGRTIRVSGHKLWSSAASCSDWGLLLARTDPTATGHRGLSLLLLDMSNPRVVVRPIRQMTGEAAFDEVTLDTAQVSVDDVVGPLNGGWSVAMSTLANERDFIAGSVASFSRRQEEMLEVARDTEASRDQSWPVRRDRVVSARVRGRALELFGMGNAGAPGASSVLKVGMADLIMDMASARCEAAGIGGILAESSPARDLSAAPGARIGGGTSEIHRNLIAERVLGLPRDVRADETPSHFQEARKAGQG